MGIKTVPITLDRPRHLRYNLNALIALGEALEINLLTKEGWEEIVGKTARDPDTQQDVLIPAVPSFRKVRAIVWAGLLHEDKTLTEDAVGDLLEPSNLAYAIKCYSEAFSDQDVTEVKDGEPGPLEASGKAA
jgi:hypothetical protein